MASDTYRKGKSRGVRLWGVTFMVVAKPWAVQTLVQAAKAREV